MMKAGILSLLLVPALCGTAMAEVRACTEIGCVNNLTIDVEPDIMEARGLYELRFVLDGKTAICKGSLPLKPCEEGASFRCSLPSIHITESGCALPEDNHTIPSINIDGLPRKVSISVREGTSVLTRTFRPVYLTSRPNGPQCEPECIQSRVTLSRTHTN